jgi:hypothetical protein
MKTRHKNRGGGEAQDEGPEFKIQYCKTNKQTKKEHREQICA